MGAVLSAVMSMVGSACQGLYEGISKCISMVLEKFSQFIAVLVAKVFKHHDSGKTGTSPPTESFSLVKQKSTEVMPIHLQEYMDKHIEEFMSKAMDFLEELFGEFMAKSIPMHGYEA